MCLITRQSKWLRAKEDIECYKVLTRSTTILPEMFFTTPFIGTPVENKIIKGRKCFRAKGRSSWEKYEYDDEKYIVSRGAIHAYLTEMGCYVAIGVGCGNVIFKCVIPKGTRYAIGVTGEICAKKIKFVKECV